MIRPGGGVPLRRRREGVDRITRLFTKRAGALLACLATCVGFVAVGASAIPARASAATSDADVTFALPPAVIPNYLFPIMSAAHFSNVNRYQFQALLYRPLYWFGKGDQPTINESLSLADLPVFSDGGKTVTITMKKYDWSDGQPVTSEDVIFFMQMLEAEESIWADFVPGEFPANVVSMAAPNPSTVVFRLNRAYSQTWFLYNELSQITPLPQHAWDKESATDAIGSYTTTTAGAKAVFNYLTREATSSSTYDTNPLWQVVDGPFKVLSFVPSVGEATLVRNMKYSGPATGSITKLQLLPFTEDAAEFNEIISGSGPDYGYVPFNDLPQLSRVKDAGYTVDPWPSWGITFINLNFVDPQYGPVFKQLYFRQAFQELVDQPAYIQHFLYGDANPTYGPVPLVPPSKFVSSQENTNPYPYSPTNAAALLRSHGWSVVPNGTDVCQRAGSGPSDCGAGVAAGTKLSISLLYNSGLEDIQEEVAALRSAASSVGINLVLSEAPFSVVVSKAIYCNKPSCWQMDYYGQGWYWNPGYEVPDGGAIFASTGESNGESYSNPTADRLINNIRSGSYQDIYTYENYLAKQLPAIWMPEIDVQVSAVSNALGGALPQDPESNIYPEDWYLRG